MAADDWRVATIGELCGVMTGGTPSRRRGDFWGGNIPWMSSGEIHQGRVTDTRESITEAGFAASNVRWIPAGAVVIALNGQGKTRGTAAILQRRMTCNQSLAAILPQQSTLVADYLFQYLSAEYPSIRRLTGDGGRNGLNLKHIRSLRIEYPPLTEQRKIAAILSSVDDAIEKTQAIIDQVQVVKRGLMRELLTRGLPGRHTRFKQTEIEEIPEEWGVCALSDLCDRMFVGIAQAATHAYSERGTPIVRTTNVRENHLDAENLLFITDEFAREMDRKSLRGGDVLTARTGYPGTSVVVPESLEGAQCFTLLVSRPGLRLRSRYLCHTMNSDHGRRIVNRGQAGGAQQNLNVSVFKKARLGVPPLEEQDAICNVLDACYALLDREENWKGVLLDMKSSLMSALLSGEVRVNPDTEAA